MPGSAIVSFQYPCYFWGTALRSLMARSKSACVTLSLPWMMTSLMASAQARVISPKLKLTAASAALRPLDTRGLERRQLGFQGRDDLFLVGQLIFDDVVEAAKQRAVEEFGMICRGDQ